MLGIYRIGDPVWGAKKWCLSSAQVLTSSPVQNSCLPLFLSMTQVTGWHIFPGLSADSAGKNPVLLQVNSLISSTNDLEWSTVLPMLPTLGTYYW